MLCYRQREAKDSFYQRISLPKNMHTSNKSISNRCISVNKHDTKNTPHNNSVISKNIVPPKPLSVLHLLASFILARAIMTTYLGEFWRKRPLAFSPNTVLLPLLTWNGNKIKKGLDMNDWLSQDCIEQSWISLNSMKLFLIKKCCLKIWNAIVKFIASNLEK